MSNFCVAERAIVPEIHKHVAGILNNQLLSSGAAFSLRLLRVSVMALGILAQTFLKHHGVSLFQELCSAFQCFLGCCAEHYFKRFAPKETCTTAEVRYRRQTKHRYWLRFLTGA